MTYRFPTYEQLRSVRGGALVVDLGGWEPDRRTWPALTEAFAEFARAGGGGAEFGSIAAPPFGCPGYLVVMLVADHNDPVG